MIAGNLPLPAPYYAGLSGSNGNLPKGETILIPSHAATTLKLVRIAIVI